MPIFEINKFRKARLAAKMTQAQAAEKIGVDPITIIQWEKGSNTPTRRNLEKAALIYDCAISDLLEQDVDLSRTQKNAFDGRREDTQ